jgi:hypothetical protein
MPARKWTRLKAWLMEHLWAPLAARSLRKTIDRVQPDVIWMIPHDFSIFPLEKILNDESRIADDKKFRVHVTIQDFPDCHGHGRLWGEDRVRRMATMQEQIYAAADTADATSHPMLEELEHRTGKRGSQMLHQGLEPEDFALLENQEPRTKNEEQGLIRIAYAGTILCEREFAIFVNLLDSLNQPRTRNQFPIEFHFYGSHSYADRRWFRPWMIEHGNLPERELVEALRECDWGFIPMSLHDDDPRYNRFSFPTKFITYLAAGLPPIVMGHPESSVMKMAEKYDVGLRMTDDGLKMKDHARQMTDGRKDDLSFPARDSSPPQDPLSVSQRFNFSAFPSRRESLPAVLQCARAEFDAVAMRKQLWRLFQNHRPERGL